MMLEEIDAKLTQLAAERVTVEQNLYRIQGAENLLMHWRAEVEAALAAAGDVEPAAYGLPTEIVDVVGPKPKPIRKAAP